jgi:hypothetical protein
VIYSNDNYFFKMKFVFFLYWLLSALWNENDLPLHISDIRQILRYRTSVCNYFALWQTNNNTPNKMLISESAVSFLLRVRSGWRCHNISVNTGSRLPNTSDVKTRKRRNVVGIDMIRNNVLMCSVPQYLSDIRNI